MQKPFFFLLIAGLGGRWKANLLAGLLACLWALEVNTHQPLPLEEQQAETRIILADRNSLDCESKNEEGNREKACKRKCCLRGFLTMRSKLMYYVFREAVEETSLLELNSALAVREASLFWVMHRSPCTKLFAMWEWGFAEHLYVGCARLLLTLFGNQALPWKCILNRQEGDFTAWFHGWGKWMPAYHQGSLWQSGEPSRLLVYQTAGWTLTMLSFTLYFIQGWSHTGCKVISQIWSNS